MTNYEMIREFVNGNKLNNAYGHLMYFQDVLVNYSTELLRIDRENKKALFNVRKYSRTTSKIQSMIENILSFYGYDVEKYDGNDCRYWNFGYQGAENWKISDCHKISLDSKF